MVVIILKNPFYDLNCVQMLQSVREEVDRHVASNVKITVWMWFCDYLLAFRPLLSKAVNRLPRIYNNRLKSPFGVFFCFRPYFTHDASCVVTLTGRSWPRHHYATWSWKTTVICCLVRHLIYSSARSGMHLNYRHCEHCSIDSRSPWSSRCNTALHHPTTTDIDRSACM